MTEINSNALQEDQTASLQAPERTKIKKEILDAKVPQYVLGQLSAIAAEASILPFTEKYGFVLSVPPILMSILSLREAHRLNIANKQEYTDQELDFTNSIRIYRGKETYKDNGIEINPKDAILNIDLPQLPEHPTAAEINVWAATCQFAFRSAKETFGDTEFKFVTIPAEKYTPRELEGKPTVADKVLLRRKTVKPKDPEQVSIILTREEFEEMSFTPNELFDQGYKHLKDTRLTAIIDRLRATTDIEERTRLTQVLDTQLIQIIQRELTAYGNIPEATGRRGAISRQYPQPKVSREKRTGTLQVSTVQGSGKRRIQPLERYLGIENQSLDQTLSDPKTGSRKRSASSQRAAAAAVLAQMVHDKPDITLEPEPPTRAQLLQQKARVSKKDEGIPQRLKLRKKPIIKTAAASALTVLTLGLGLNVTSEMEDVQELLRQRTPATEKVVKTKFPKSPPKHHLEWQIENQTNEPVSGYFTTETSHKLNADGAWVINNDVEEERNYPATVDQATPHLTLTKTIFLNPDETEFKIPIKNGTELAALSLTDESGHPLENYTAEILTDGTVKVTIDNSFFDTKVIATVSAQLVPDTDGDAQIKAVEKLPAINEELLSPAAQRLLKEAQIQGPTGDYFERNLEQIIRDAYLYSLHPDGAEKLDTAKTPEEIINVLVDVYGMHCDAAGDLNVLLDTTDPDKTQFLNIAGGYMIGLDDNPASEANQNYLNEISLHHYGIDENGDILDATPSIPANDEVTRAYVAEKEKPGRDLVNEWKAETDAKYNQAKKEIDKRKALADKLKLLSGVMLSASGYLVARQSRQLLQRRFKDVSIEDITDNVVLKTFNDETISDAYNFLSWVSWARGEEPPDNDNTFVSPDRDQPSQERTKQEVLHDMRMHFNPDFLRLYVEHPIGFERRARLSKKDGIKFRMLARYLLR